MILAIVSGILSAISLPTVIGGRLLPDLGILAWIALVPLYLVLAKAGVKRSFRLGFVYGLVHFGTSLYWIFIALHKYGEAPVPLALFTLGLAVAIEAVFPAVACVLAVSIARAKRGVPLSVSFILSWVVFEFFRTYLPFGGFAWANMVYSQRSFLTLLQSLDLTGVYGPLFLLLMANAVGGEVALRCRDSGRYLPVKMAAIFGVLLVVTLTYGHFRSGQVSRFMQKAETIKISLIQGNIPQEEKWLEEKIEEIIARHLVLTEESEKGSPDLVIWPEAAFPAVIPPGILQVEELKGVKTPLLMGVVTYEGVIPEHWPPKREDHFSLHNSAVLLEPGGFIADRYHKVHLVPMGEYVPLENVFSFMGRIVPAMSSFSPGEGWYLMNLENYKFGVTICYEDLFPEISRSFTRQGADFLVNLTNDGWYENSSAVFQHLDFSRFRAIENRRAMVRATNTGRTAFFSPTGEITASLPAFEEAIVEAPVPIGGPGSFYTRFGDLFAWSCVGMLGLIVIRGILARCGLLWRKNGK